MEIVNTLMPFIKALLMAIIGFIGTEIVIAVAAVIFWIVLAVKAIKEEVWY